MLSSPSLLLATCLLAQAAGPSQIWPTTDWERAEPEAVGLDRETLELARDYALSGSGSGMIVRGGKLVLSWGDPSQTYDLKSSTKAIGGTALGLALMDRKLALSDRVRRLHPGLTIPPVVGADEGWLDEITILHLATQTSGFEKQGGYGRVQFRPGTAWFYSDAGPNWLAECLTLAYRRDLDELLFERVFTPIGIGRDDLTWRPNRYRPKEIDGIPRRELGAGISANVDAMARIGLLYLRGGSWQGRQILPADFVAKTHRTVPEVVGLPVHGADAEHGDAPRHYGLLWWNNADGTLAGLPRDAAWTWGLYDSLIVVIPSLDLAVARAGQSWARREGAGHYDPLRPFLVPIASAVRTASIASAAPYPPSRRIVGIDWAPASAIVRKARGGDNWPMTWGDDDAQYTAYGDARGFEPFVPRKLSMGLARVVGPADDFRGINILAPTLETIGEGNKGKKASGILMVDGILYLWGRNAGNSQLAWSIDHGATWTWADWKFTSSFGCPTFLNFGRNYSGARDQYVYVYSQDADSAYEAADRMVLARVPKDRIRDRSAYEFLSGYGPDQHPTWTDDIDGRSAVFSQPGRCYRSSVTFNPGLDRYLMVQILFGPEPRFRGGFGIYDAPEPWGPWTTASFIEEWDTGPGETGSFPTRWISADGRTLHYVFSGDDYFSVRRADLIVRRPSNHP